MINFKLAEYKEGKFKAFIPLSKKGIFTHEEVQEIEEDEAFLIGDGNIVTLRKLGHDSICETYFLDKKDPLNRFDGLFNGRTYGEGRFVLMQVETLDGHIISDYDIIKVAGYGNMLVHTIDVMFPDLVNYVVEQDFEGTLGNLHENPELYDKII